MSLFADPPDLAIVSLGLSCQTAHQINNNAAYFQRFAPVSVHGSYFDCLITPIDTLIRFVENGVPHFVDPKVLTWTYGPYWPSPSTTAWITPTA